MLRPVFVLLLLFLSVCLVTGQPAYRFEQLPSDMRLLQGGINCITQDKKGMLWLGTWSGLTRYDGYSLRTFQEEPGVPDGLQSDQVTSLVEDHAGMLWVGTLSAGIHPGFYGSRSAKG